MRYEFTGGPAGTNSADKPVERVRGRIVDARLAQNDLASVVHDALDRKAGANVQRIADSPGDRDLTVDGNSVQDTLIGNTCST